MPKKQFAYLLSYDFETNGLYCVESDTKGFNEYRFYDGKWIEDWPEDILFIVEGEKIEDFMVCYLHYMLISERVRCALVEKDIQGVQYLPVRVVHRLTKENLGPYWALNVIPTVEKLRWNSIQGKDLFRYASTSVYISESLKNFLEQAQLTSGAGFVRIPQRLLDREDPQK